MGGVGGAKEVSLTRIVMGGFGHRAVSMASCPLPRSGRGVGGVVVEKYALREATVPGFPGAPETELDERADLPVHLSIVGLYFTF